LHPPSNSNPLNASESMPAEAYVACVVARPPVEWIALDKVCLFMILSLDANVSAPACPTVPAFPESAREPKLLCSDAEQPWIELNFARPGVDLKIDSDRSSSNSIQQALQTPDDHERMFTN
jgi:hypothetical protein